MAQISCMSFNVLACMGRDPNWEHASLRFPGVMRIIQAEMPDLIGIQEACSLFCEGSAHKDYCSFDWREQLIREMPALGYGYVALQEQKDFKLHRQHVTCGLMIFYKKDRFEIREDGCAEFEHDTHRYYQWARLFDRDCGRDILFTNTHFSTNPGVLGQASGVAGEAYRTIEAARLLNFWHNNCDENTALFATGDYNSVPHSLTQQLLRSRQFQPSFLVAEEADERGTYHGAKAAHVLDYCFVNPSAQTVTKYYPITTRFENPTGCKYGGFPSDHRAIMTYCNYKTEE